MRELMDGSAVRGTAERPRQRVAAVDAVRGLAVVCMIVDHLTLVLGGPPVVRLTIGRVAMPLFFVTAGYCAQRSGRLRWRHAEVAAIGLLLPLVVPWIDAPNVLLWWAWGAVLLAALRMAQFSPAVLVVIALATAANGWMETGPGSSYPPHALFGLMALGALLPTAWWAWGERLPARSGLAWLGRHALAVYVGHVLLLAAVGRVL